MHAKLRVVVHKADEGGYWAEVPALPGCYTQAETLAELRRNVQAAVDLYLATTPVGQPRKPARADGGRRKSRA
jgi:predicted RNase H-like HicB family nuclease